MTEEDTNVALEHPNGWDAYELVGTYLDDDGWYPEAIEGTTAYRCGFSGTNAKFRVVAHINVELEQLYIYLIAEAFVAEDRRHAVAEFITRANYGMRIGNFEMDFNDGEIRYKSSLDFEGAPLTTGLIHNALYPAASTIDRYYPGIMRVAFGDTPPAEAVEAIENPA